MLGMITLSAFKNYWTAVREQSATAVIRDVSRNQADSSAARLSLPHAICSCSVHISHHLPQQEKVARVNTHITATAPQLQECAGVITLCLAEMCTCVFEK